MSGVSFRDFKEVASGLSQDPSASSLLIVRSKKEKERIQKEYPQADIRISKGFPPNVSRYVTDLFEGYDVPKEHQKKFAHASAGEIFREAARAQINFKKPKVSSTTTDANGRTLLHLAAMTGEPEKVRALIEAGCAVNAQDYFGNTPLHYSWMLDDKASQKHLQDGKAKLDICNIFKAVPLDYKKLLEPANDKEKVEVQLYDAKTQTLKKVSSKEIHEKFTSLSKVTFTADALVHWFLIKTPQEVLTEVGRSLSMKGEFYTKKLNTQMVLCTLSQPKPLIVNSEDIFFHHRKDLGWGLYAAKNLPANHPVAFYGGTVYAVITAQQLPKASERCRYWSDVHAQKTSSTLDTQTLIFDAYDSFTLAVFFNTPKKKKGANIIGRFVLSQGTLQEVYSTAVKVKKGEELLSYYGDLYLKNLGAAAIDLENQPKLPLKNSERSS